MHSNRLLCGCPAALLCNSRRDRRGVASHLLEPRFRGIDREVLRLEQAAEAGVCEVRLEGKACMDAAPSAIAAIRTAMTNSHARVPR